MSWTTPPWVIKASKWRVSGTQGKWHSPPRRCLRLSLDLVPLARALPRLSLLDDGCNRPMLSRVFAYVQGLRAKRRLLEPTLRSSDQEYPASTRGHRPLTKPFRNSKLHIRATMSLKIRGNFMEATISLKTIRLQHCYLIGSASAI